MNIESQMRLGKNLLLGLPSLHVFPMSRRVRVLRLRVLVKCNHIEALKQADEEEGRFVVGEL
jgi:hypothetical protein